MNEKVKHPASPPIAKQHSLSTDKKSDRPEPANSLFLSALGIALFAIVAYFTSDWSIFFMAGICIFLLLYPLINESALLGKGSLKKQISTLVAICILTSLVLSYFFKNADSHATVVTVIMAALGIKLVFYPIYPTDT